MTLLEQCQRWHENEEYQKIIAELEALPAEERSPALDSELARAYNNAASVEDRAYFEKAIALLTPHAEHFAGDHLWNFRMGYSYYYLDREDRALPYFEEALAALPGDADTERMIESCRKMLALPLFGRPFRSRVQEAWAAFAQAETELRALMDSDEDRGEELIARVEEILRIAFDDVAFGLGKGGAKYELILTPESMRIKLFSLVYFTRLAPASVREHWDIHVGRTASVGFALRTDDYSIEMEDVAVWFAQEGEGIALTLYCEKLLPLLVEDEDRAWWMLSMIVDQALGEIAAMRLIHDFDVLDAPRAEPPILLTDLPKALEEAGLSLDSDAEDYLEHSYLAYERDPDTSAETDWRLDVYTGSTRLPSLLSAYMENDAALVNMYHADGIAAGFIAYPLPEDLHGKSEEILDFRDTLMEAITEAAGADAVTFLGGATGTSCGYLDFIAWDLRAVLDAAVHFLTETTLPWALFHSFRRDANPICLLDRTEEDQESDAPAASSLLSPAAVKKMEALDDGLQGDHTLVPFDLWRSGFDAYPRLAGLIQEDHGKLDAIINLAAVCGGLRPLAHADPTGWLQGLQVNLTAPLWLFQTLLPLMQAAAAPRFIVSLHREHRAQSAYWHSYGVAQAALAQLVHDLYQEKHAYPTLGFAIVDPGWVDTPLSRSVFPAGQPHWQSADAVAPHYLAALTGDSGQLEHYP